MAPFWLILTFSKAGASTAESRSDFFKMISSEVPPQSDSVKYTVEINTLNFRELFQNLRAVPEALLRRRLPLYFDGILLHFRSDMYSGDFQREVTNNSNWFYGILGYGDSIIQLLYSTGIPIYVKSGENVLPDIYKYSTRILSIGMGDGFDTNFLYFKYLDKIDELVLFSRLTGSDLQKLVSFKESSIKYNKAFPKLVLSGKEAGSGKLLNLADAVKCYVLDETVTDDESNRILVSKSIRIAVQVLNEVAQSLLKIAQIVEYISLNNVLSMDLSYMKKLRSLELHGFISKGSLILPDAVKYVVVHESMHKFVLNSVIPSLADSLEVLEVYTPFTDLRGIENFTKLQSVRVHNRSIFSNEIDTNTSTHANVIPEFFPIGLPALILNGMSGETKTQISTPVLSLTVHAESWKNWSFPDHTLIDLDLTWFAPNRIDTTERSNDLLMNLPRSIKALKFNPGGYLSLSVDSLLPEHLKDNLNSLTIDFSMHFEISELIEFWGEWRNLERFQFNYWKQDISKKFCELLQGIQCTEKQEKGREGTGWTTITLSR
jgi:hypothetical protein